MSEVHEVIIIGSGPAGLTAAIYTARANLAPLVIEGIGAGGQLMLTTDVENYPGFPDGHPRPRAHGAVPRAGRALRRRVRHRRRRSRRPLVGTRSGSGSATREYTRRARSSSRPAPRPACSASTPSSALLGHGVSTCATCDGFFFRGHDDRGRRRRRLRARGGDLPHPLRRQGHARSTGARSCARRRSCRTARSRTRRSSSAGTASSKTSIGDGRVEALVLRDIETDATSELAVTGVFVAIGHDPNTEAVPRPARPRRRRLHRHRARTRRRRRSPACSRPATCRTTSTARRSPPPGPGCMAALEAERYLEALGDRTSRRRSAR